MLSKTCQNIKLNIRAYCYMYTKFQIKIYLCPSVCFHCNQVIFDLDLLHVFESTTPFQG